jgi:putative lipoprotein (rSAM/lipoprotein system)
MKTKVFRLYSAVLSVLLSVLGFSSCSKEEPREEYGSPYAHYQFIGEVTDEDGNPLTGILVSAEDISENYCRNFASKKTDGNGGYDLTVLYHSPYDPYTKIVVQDIDGEANGGEFANDTIDINYESGKKVGEGDGKWFEGTFTITQNIQLKKK